MLTALHQPAVDTVSAVDVRAHGRADRVGDLEAADWTFLTDHSQVVHGSEERLYDLRPNGLGDERHAARCVCCVLCVLWCFSVGFGVRSADDSMPFLRVRAV